MKIVFWSEEAECGTTSNMIAAASMLAAKYSYRVAMVAAEKHMRDLADNFSKPDTTTVNEDCAYYALEGLDYLLMAGKYGNLTKYHLEEAFQTVSDGRLFCLPQGARMLCDYYPKETRAVLSQVIRVLDETVDFSFIDCGNGMDDWTKEQMKQADLVVVNFRQNAQEFDQFFSEHADVSDKVVYFIGSYQKESVYNKKNIHRIYRVAPEKLGVIPYNPEFEVACREGKLDKYIRGKKLLLPTDMREYFFEELEHTVQIIIQRSKQVKAGKETKARGREQK